MKAGLLIVVSGPAGWEGKRNKACQGIDRQSFHIGLRHIQEAAPG